MKNSFIFQVIFPSDGGDGHDDDDHGDDGDNHGDDVHDDDDGDGVHGSLRSLRGLHPSLRG